MDSGLTMKNHSEFLALGVVGVLAAAARLSGDRGSRSQMVFRADGSWHHQSDDGRYHDVHIPQEALDRFGELFDSAWVSMWPKAMEMLHQMGPGTQPESALNRVFGEVDIRESGNLAGDIFDAVYSTPNGIEDVAYWHFSGRDGDSPDLERFELLMEDQIRNGLIARAERFTSDRHFPGTVVAMWVGRLHSNY